jgi:hypothetical protein
MMDTDAILQNKFMHTKIRHAIADNKHNSTELNILKLRRLTTIGEVIQRNNDSKNMLRRILKPELKEMLNITDNIYAGMPIPDKISHETIFDVNKNRWLRCSNISSRQIRLLIKSTEIITNTKLTALTQDEATTFYKKINKLRSTQNKTKMLRLIHGDVYCGTRIKKYKLSDHDTCIRCFEKETIKHLLMECPYTQEIWSTLGVDYTQTNKVIGVGMTKEELEIQADLLSSIVFKKGILPPNILIELTYLKYSKGLCKNTKVKDLATDKLEQHNVTGRWH